MKRLKELRLSKGVSGAEVARFLGITRQAYGYYESGHRNPPKYALEKLAAYFQVTIDDLVENKVSDSKIVYLDPPWCYGAAKEAGELLSQLPEYRQKQYVRRIKEDLEFLKKE